MVGTDAWMGPASLVNAGTDFKTMWKKPRKHTLRWTSGLWKIKDAETQSNIGNIVWGLVQGPMGFHKLLFNWVPVGKSYRTLREDITGFLGLPHGGLRWEDGSYSLRFGWKTGERSIAEIRPEEEKNRVHAHFRLPGERGFHLDVDLENPNTANGSYGWGYHLDTDLPEGRTTATLLPVVRGKGTLIDGDFLTRQVDIHGYMDMVGAVRPTKTGWDYFMLYGKDIAFYGLRWRQRSRDGWYHRDAVLLTDKNGGQITTSGRPEILYNEKEWMRDGHEEVEVPVQWGILSTTLGEFSANLRLDNLFGTPQHRYGALGLKAVENFVVGEYSGRGPAGTVLEKVPVTGFVESTYASGDPFLPRRRVAPFGGGRRI